ncbi:hypothetical protein F5Y09DRAFT_356370 [Xylaria sp. FL1042]|nr:hypothetical protein F5Y09DRAFT_356370 [Xylaria sp. FL1042]
MPPKRKKASDAYDYGYASSTERRTQRVRVGYETGGKTDSAVNFTDSTQDVPPGRSRSRSRSRTTHFARNEIATAEPSSRGFLHNVPLSLFTSLGTQSPANNNSYNNNNNNENENESTTTSICRTVCMKYELPIRRKVDAGDNPMSDLNNSCADELSGYEGGNEDKEPRARKKKSLVSKRREQGLKEADKKGRLDLKRSENIWDDSSNSDHD